MKKVKINLLAIIGMMVAVGTLAFTAPKENLATTHWFEVDQNGDITDYLGSDSAGESELISLECELETPSPEMCGAGLSDEQVDQTGPDTFEPKAGIDVNSPGVQRVYKEPESI